MTAAAFLSKYGPAKRSIQETAELWAIRSRIDELAKIEVAPNVTFMDAVANESLHEHLTGIPKEVVNAFSTLMHEKAQTADQIKGLFHQKALLGSHSVEGLINKIQGQLGENAFLAHAGKVANLAKSGSQEAWDLVIHRGSHSQFVQVKIYHSADAVIGEMRKLAERLASEKLKYSGTVIRKIDFAVNDDVYEPVRRRVASEGLNFNVLKVHATREHLRGVVTEAAHHATMSGLHQFFEELFAGAVIGVGLNAAINGFLLWKGSIERERAIEDTLYGSIASVGGITATLAVRATLFSKLPHLLGPVGRVASPLGSLAVAYASRELIKRLGERRHLVRSLEEGNENLRFRLSARHLGRSQA